MKINFKLCVPALLLFGLLISGAAVAQQKTALSKAVDKYVRAQAADGEEYRDARKIVEADVDGDGDLDAVVQYTIEGAGGGNSWGQQLAVFINTKGVYKMAADETVGGKFFRSFELKSAANGKITGETETCPADEPQGLCDNPKKATATFGFKNNKLTELQND